ncbi:hypothetical protein [Poseidonibacter ostreae]|uniref:Uncharacterized protein n=1 Tax=Poseidonibacter ostreae TaxID=2654171 RepID=A0ABQ6VIU2_9BACT|nr:hypothetical protein [Poseidonibacter ostreae]KAB7884883.1 hypothetical protein GA417_10040 [Poseidonibacter ostreae]KAB7888946.1 hypothetical protein GBG18_11985 [Poseidonibacter ostreae]
MQLIKYTDLVELFLVLLILILIIFSISLLLFYKLIKKDIYKLRVENVNNFDNLENEINLINDKKVDKLIHEIHQEVLKKENIYQIIENQHDLQIYLDEKHIEIIEGLKVEMNEQKKQEIEIYKLLNIINRKLHKNKIV